MEWKKISETSPEIGERVVLYNGIRPWIGEFKVGLLSEFAKFPPTHYARLELPYEPVAPDLTSADDDRSGCRIRAAMTNAKVSAKTIVSKLAKGSRT